MALKKKPVTGMKDMMPAEMEIRDYVIGQIKETYRAFGFSSIETPCVEHIENLCSKQGGDNEKLIFKILKRGEKLKIEEAKEEKDVVDGGASRDHFLMQFQSDILNKEVLRPAIRETTTKLQGPPIRIRAKTPR